jgi:hypothetical protein
MIPILNILLIGLDQVASFPKLNPSNRLLERQDSDGYALVSSKQIVLFGPEGKREHTLSKAANDKVFSVLPGGEVVGTVETHDWIIYKGATEKQRQWLPRENRFLIEGLIFSDSLRLSVRSSGGSCTFDEVFDRYTGLGVGRGTSAVYFLQPPVNKGGLARLVTYKPDLKGGYSKSYDVNLSGPNSKSNTVYCPPGINRLIPISSTEVVFVGIEGSAKASKLGLDLTKFPLSDPRVPKLSKVGLYRANISDGSVSQVATCLATDTAEAKFANYDGMQLSKSGKWLYLESYASVVRIPVLSLLKEIKD